MTDLFSRSAQSIVGEALDRFKPMKIYAGFSGGNDSLALCHWMMTNVPGTELFHINTGIGLKSARAFVHDTAKKYGWPLTEIRALEDCGQDYDAIVRQYGFPGPRGHQYMYRRLKERGVELLVRRAKKTRMDKVLLATGIREDESIIRAGYKGHEVHKKGAQIWANPIYWWDKYRRDQYLMENQIRSNPMCAKLGLSGECGCGAYAQPGELERWRIIEPEFGERIDRLHAEVKDRFPWGWEGHPPPKEKESNAIPIVGALCIGCEKSAIVQEEMLLP